MNREDFMWALDYLLSGAETYASGLGEQFGLGFRRANPPLGLVGRRCECTKGGVTRVGTIRGVYENDEVSAVWVEHEDGRLHQHEAHLIRLLPWTDDADRLAELEEKIAAEFITGDR